MPPLKMSETSTAKVAYDGLRQITYGADMRGTAGPTLPWSLLKAILPRHPTIFVVMLPASAGDSGQFTRVLTNLVECLPGKQHLLCLQPGKGFWERDSQYSQSLAEPVIETADPVEWLYQMRASPLDVVITNQLFFPARNGAISDERQWERLLHDELYNLPSTQGMPVLL